MTVQFQKIYNESCLETFNRLDDGEVDLVLTDPPYGVDLDYDEYDDTQEQWRQLFLDFISEAKRVADMVICPSCKITELEFIYDNHPPDWLIAWHKGSPGQRSYVGFGDWEPLLVYGKTYSGLKMHDHFTVPNTNKTEGEGHPCPKPIKWATWLVKRATVEGDIVYDPFMGSGTVAEACQRLNRCWIGSEISEEYVEIAEDRIRQASEQQELL